LMLRSIRVSAIRSSTLFACCVRVLVFGVAFLFGLPRYACNWLGRSMLAAGSADICECVLMLRVGRASRADRSMVHLVSEVVGPRVRWHALHLKGELWSVGFGFPASLLLAIALLDASKHPCLCGTQFESCRLVCVGSPSSFLACKCVRYTHPRYTIFLVVRHSCLAESPDSFCATCNRLNQRVCRLASSL
jgi:hypothetical protein